jgi:DNA modification methylase
MEERIKLMLGDNMKSLKELPDNSVDSIVTDPPYALTSIKKRFGKEGSAPAQFGTDGAFQRASKGFMGKEWDAEVPTVEFWNEVYRVLKPGGHVLSFGGTRTYHRMAVNIEDAGFEIRDQIMWIYGSGFPKSHNIGKAIDKRGGESIGWFGEWLKKWREENEIPQSQIAELFPSKTGGLTGCVSNWELGNNLPTNEQFNKICEAYDLPFKSLEEAEREFLGTKTSGIGKAFTKDGWGSGQDEVEITKGNSEWEGWGTAIKPAVEPICVVRKPLSEKSVAENVLKWGTGGLNIDASRIGSETITTNGYGDKGFVAQDGYEPSTHEGRFPANVILECICDETHTKQAPKSGHWSKTTTKGFGEFGNGNSTYEGVGEKESGDMVIHTNPNCPCYILNQQSGVSNSGKNKIRTSDGFNENAYGKGIGVKVGQNNGEYGDKGGASRFFYVPKVSKKERNRGIEKNGHPTVKPINLLTYLIRLVTPKNGVVMDCFMGSGSTGIAAQLEGFKFIGMEMDEDYFNIAEARINAYEEYRELLK